MNNKKMVSIILTIFLFVGNLFFIPIDVHAAVTSISAPTSVKAASSSYSSINTSWGAVTGASGYEVYRATSSTGSYSLIATTSGTSYNNTGLTTNSTYYYKVRAYTIVQTTKTYSSFSTIVSAKPIPSTPSVKAVSSSYNSVITSWGAVTGVNGYEVYRATSSTGTYSLIITTTSTSYNNTGLSTNIAYYYKVRAYRMVGTAKVYSNFSTIVSTKPIPSTPVVKVVSSSSTSITTSWGSIAGTSGYEVYRATSSTGTYSLLTTTTSTGINHTGLITYNTYYYKVRAYTLVGTVKVYGNFSSVVSAVPTLTPKFTVDVSPPTATTGVVILYISNFGTKTLRINNNSSALYYNSTSTNNRDLQLIDRNGNNISYLDIPSGSSAYVFYGVIGNKTWYDDYAFACFSFTYDSANYYGLVSAYYGAKFLRQ